MPDFHGVHHLYSSILFGYFLSTTDIQSQTYQSKCAKAKVACAEVKAAKLTATQSQTSQMVKVPKPGIDNLLMLAQAYRLYFLVLE